MNAITIDYPWSTALVLRHGAHDQSTHGGSSTVSAGERFSPLKASTLKGMKRGELKTRLSGIEGRLKKATDKAEIGQLKGERTTIKAIVAKKAKEKPSQVDIFKTSNEDSPIVSGVAQTVKDPGKFKPKPVARQTRLLPVEFGLVKPKNKPTPKPNAPKNQLTMFSRISG